MTWPGSMKILNDMPDSEPLYRRSLAIAEENFGPYHQHVADSLNNLASVLVGLGEYEEAEQAASPCARDNGEEFWGSVIL